MKAGDLVTFEGVTDVFGIGDDPPRAYGLVVEETNGYVKIRWNDGKGTVINGQTILRGSLHQVFAA